MVQRPRNDPRQYDDLAGEWWRPAGEFAALHWIAEARAALLPPPARDGAPLLDVGCGGGLVAPHLPHRNGRRYRHVGVDVTASALAVAGERGVDPVQGDAVALPFADESFDVVVAGEILEHVADLEASVAECARVLAPGGTVVGDPVADTARARLSLVTVGERLPGGPPRRCHDPELFVDPHRLRALFAAHGIVLRLRGLAAHPLQYLRFLLTRRGRVRMRPVRSLGALYQGVGVKCR
jgi:2-polyprenyl-6-hydroxyphenyl methylase / 3-demethylubiquinone-9 3-methyltransferase